MQRMFATLLGDLPPPDSREAASREELLDAVIRAQEAVGLEPISDAGFGIGATPVDRWRATEALTTRMAKQAVLGPYSRGIEQGDRQDISSLVAMEIRELREAGCQYIEVREPQAAGITTEVELTAFRRAHDGLLDGLPSGHVSLVVTGGNADQAGVETLLTAPFASLSLDLIDGPDNWRLAAAAPREVGIVCGAISSAPKTDDRPEVLLWAAEYAASLGGRGLARVGLATAGSLASAPWDVALRKLEILAEAVRLAELPPGDRARYLDPRAVDIRSAAMGHGPPERSPASSRPPDPAGG